MTKKTAQPPLLWQSTSIRRIWQDDQWYFSVIDIIGILTQSEKPRDYWYRVKERLVEEDKSQLSTVCRQLKLPASDGKLYVTDCANIAGI